MLVAATPQLAMAINNQKESRPPAEPLRSYNLPHSAIALIDGGIGVGVAIGIGVRDLDSAERLAADDARTR